MDADDGSGHVSPAYAGVEGRWRRPVSVMVFLPERCTLTRRAGIEDGSVIFNPRRLVLPVLAVTVRRPGEPQCFSPVHAGVEARNLWSGRRRWSQPRVCGSGGFPSSLEPACSMSAPRMRGWRDRHRLRPRRQVVSPAHAGVEARTWRCWARSARQPRVCGGRGSEIFTTQVLLESAPRTRGSTSTCG